MYESIPRCTLGKSASVETKTESYPPCTIEFVKFLIPPIYTILIEVASVLTPPYQLRDFFEADKDDESLVFSYKYNLSPRSVSWSSHFKKHPIDIRTGAFGEAW